MAMVTFLGRDFDIAPYRLGAMIEAAPFLDAQKERTKAAQQRAGIEFLPSDDDATRTLKAIQLASANTMAEAMANMADAVRILHIGIARIDSSVTVQMLLDDVEPTADGIAKVLNAVRAVTSASGLVSGEAKAPDAAAPDAAEPSPNDSAPSSSSLSPQA